MANAWRRPARDPRVAMRASLVWILLCVPVALGLFRLRFDAEPLSLLPPEVPSVAGLRLHQKLFPSGRELLITVQSPDAGVTAAVAESIAVDLRADPARVAAARWQVAWRENLPENIAWMWLQQSATNFTQFTERLQPESLRAGLLESRAQLATSLDPMELARAGYDPLGFLSLPTLDGSGSQPAGDEGVFANASGLFRVVMVEPARPGMAYREATAWLAAIRERVAAVQRRTEGGPGVQVAFTGGPAFLSEVASGMEGDLRTSVLSTVLVIALLFWLAHRSFRPLGFLLASLGITLVLTLAAGGLFLGTLNVISCGFAAVMMGLVVDYGLVGYQEFRAHPTASMSVLRSRVLPGIGWSAVTTAGTFLSLGWAGLPGLAELGKLTAMGLGIGAVVMVFWFLPRAGRKLPDASCQLPESATGESVTHGGRLPSGGGIGGPPAGGSGPTLGGDARGPGGLFWKLGTGTLVTLLAVLLWMFGWPKVVGGAEPLRPRNSAAYAAMQELQQQMGGSGNAVLLLFRGSTAAAVLEQMHAAEPPLQQAVSEGSVRSFRLPTGFWPDPAAAAIRKGEAGKLASRSGEFRAQLQAAGFSTNSFALTGRILDHWREWSTNAAGVPVWPDNDGAKWLSGVVSARDSNGDWIGLGTVETTVPAFRLEGLPAGVLVTGWDRLGPDLMARVGRRVAGLTAGIGLVLVGCLWLAFRRWSEVLLSLAALALSFLILLAAMASMGATWNLLNLVAVPLLLGTSVDSTIHVQLALRREGGILRALWRTTGVALVLCAGANIAGFGSLAWSSNAGLASLDLVCAGGVVCVLAVSLLLLPRWWGWLHPFTVAAAPPGPGGGASHLYGPAGWRVASALARSIPRRLLVAAARCAARLYCLLRPERLEGVVSNLLPVVGGDPERARHAARENFGEFAEKLVDLWRHEALGPGAVTVAAAAGWQSFHDAMGSGRGVLLVTPHLGNWELGGSMLVGFGVKPLVLTAPEPGTGLTGIRAEARARHGVETLVVGADPFAFVQVIRRLQEGGVVALLLDRPMPGTGVDVEFLGAELSASPAAADLARATGAVILPVYVVREAGQHRAYALPPVTYDRARLGNREERRELTGRILRRFEPAVRQFPGQWFHFVPVWQSKRGKT